MECFGKKWLNLKVKPSDLSFVDAYKCIFQRASALTGCKLGFFPTKPKETSLKIEYIPYAILTIFSLKNALPHISVTKCYHLGVFIRINMAYQLPQKALQKLLCVYIVVVSVKIYYITVYILCKLCLLGGGAYCFHIVYPPVHSSVTFWFLNILNRQWWCHDQASNLGSGNKDSS